MIYALYLSSLIISAIVASILAQYFWRRRQAPGGLPATIVMLAIVIWSLGYVLQFRSTGLSGQIFATYIQYLGIVTVPVAWFIFSLQYTGRNSWLTRGNLFFLLLIPSITLALVWTSSLHNLIWQGRHLETSGPFIVIVKTYGPWFWVHTVFSYSLVLLGTLFLIRRLFRPPRLYRSQSIALLVSAVTPLVWNVLYVFHFFPTYRIDLTPSAFTISGLAIALGLFRFRLLDIIPVARETIIEYISDGIIVLDTQNRFIDINPAAQRIIGHSLSDVIGQSFVHILSAQQELIERSYIDTIGMMEVHDEVVINRDDTPHYYQLRVSPLRDRHGNFIGRLVFLHDITEHKLLKGKIKEMEGK